MSTKLETDARPALRAAWFRVWPAQALSALPTGDRLPESGWHRRHRWICAVLWIHVVLVPLYGAFQSEPLSHALLEGALLPGALAALAAHHRFRRTLRSILATAGLIASSAALVHLSGGLIEMHFHFLVVVVLVSLYQTWQPFLIGLVAVLLHHGVVGTLTPHAVYNHPAAIEHPWAYGALHAGFVLALGLICLATWRLNESALAGERQAREDLERLSYDLAAAQQIAGVGSWDWSSSNDQVWWSRQMYRIAGVSTELQPSISLFLDLVHHEDRDEVTAALQGALEGVGHPDVRCRLVRPDGDIRIIHCRAGAVTDLGDHLRAVGTCQDITDQARLEHEIEYRAHHDPLTGLPNRTRFLHLVGEATSAPSTSGEQAFVLCLDLDDFKTVNDTLGHSIGDRLLIEVADRLQSVVRPGDVTARLGGDEFAVLLDRATPDLAHTIATRLLATLESPFTTGGNHLVVRASLGVASTARGADPEQLLQHADIALYAAKAQAPGTVSHFDPQMLTRVTERANLESELATAIAEDELVVHYQPLFDLHHGLLRDVEALVRWQHPRRGLLGPGEFIPLAEETGLICELGRYVLDRALTEVGALSRTLERRIGVSVNVATQQLGGDLVAQVPRALARSGVRAQDLTLEITESTLMDPMKGEITALRQLRDQGVKIAIDDFGTGYSSLAYLRQLPIDRLKIDRAFVQELDGGDNDDALVATIISLASTLGLDTVAEGIESARQVERLIDLGCVHGQGFHLARPAPLEDLHTHFLLREPASN